MFKLPTYVVVTAARDEARFVEGTIRSMLAQTVRPLKWVIVSDGSTDGTDEIVKRYAEYNSWIEFARMPDRVERHFAGKVHAFNSGLAKLKDLPYDLIACLDADLTFEDEYFCFILNKMAEDTRLGLVATTFQEPSAEAYDYRYVNPEDASGPCQVFRRECFEAIGGYLPVKGGTIDTIASITARMKGWKTVTFTEKYFVHHRELGTAQRGALQARFYYGEKDYALGNHPIWELFRGVYQMTKRPYIARGLALVFGYLWAYALRRERPVSHEFIEFYRREQMLRLKKAFRNKVQPVVKA